MRTGGLAGIDNRIKVLERVAYGFRDDAHFFLERIRTAFPEMPDEPKKRTPVQN